MLRSTFLGSLGAATLAPFSGEQFGSSITIGLIAPFTGPHRRIGERLGLGAHAAIDAANAGTNALSRTFALHTFDDIDEVSSAVVQGKIAADDQGIVAMIGHGSADTTLQALPLYADAHLPLVVPLSTDDRLTAERYHSIFRLPTKDAFEGRLSANALLKRQRPSVPYVFIEDGVRGTDVADGFMSALADAKITARYAPATDAATHAAAVATALRFQPDYVFLAGTVAALGALVAMLRAKGYRGEIGASSGFYDPATLALGAPASGLLVASSMPFLAVAPSTLRVRQAFEAAHGAFTPESAFGYAAVQLVVAAVRRAAALDRSAVIRSLADPAPLATLVGDYVFTAAGDPVEPQAYFYTVENGAFRYAHAAHTSDFVLK